MAKVYKSNTVKGKDLLVKASYNIGYDLYDVYDSFSQAKRNAYEECRAWYAEDDGENFRIISACRNNFSVAWEMTYEGKPATRIETYMNTYIVIKEDE